MDFAVFNLRERCSLRMYDCSSWDFWSASVSAVVVVVVAVVVVVDVLALSPASGGSVLCFLTGESGADEPLLPLAAPLSCDGGGDGHGGK